MFDTVEGACAQHAYSGCHDVMLLNELMVKLVTVFEASVFNTGVAMPLCLRFLYSLSSHPWLMLPFPLAQVPDYVYPAVSLLSSHPLVNDYVPGK